MHVWKHGAGAVQLKWCLRVPEHAKPDPSHAGGSLNDGPFGGGGGGGSYDTGYPKEPQAGNPKSKSYTSQTPKPSRPCKPYKAYPAEQQHPETLQTPSKPHIPDRNPQRIINSQKNRNLISPKAIETPQKQTQKPHRSPPNLISPLSPTKSRKSPQNLNPLENPRENRKRALVVGDNAPKPLRGSRV